MQRAGPAGLAGADRVAAVSALDGPGLVAGRARRAAALLGAIYIALWALHWRGEGGFGSLDEVRALFAVPGLLVAGWVHYLAFDLFVGVWIASCSPQLRWGTWR